MTSKEKEGESGQLNISRNNEDGKNDLEPCIALPDWYINLSFSTHKEKEKEKEHLNLCIIPKQLIPKSLKIRLTFNKNESKPKTKK